MSHILESMFHQVWKGKVHHHSVAFSIILSFPLHSFFFIILKGIRWLRLQLKLNCCYETEGEAEKGSREEERDLEEMRGREGGENLEIAKDKKLNFKTVAYNILLIRLQTVPKCLGAKYWCESMPLCVCVQFVFCEKIYLCKLCMNKAATMF